MSMLSQSRFYKDLYKHYLFYKFNKPYKQYEYNGSKDIPKVLHYAWFGTNDISDNIRYCIKSWEKLEGFEVKRWDEKNFPIDKYPFAKRAYEQKKWAMVSDVARLHALFYEGGIYVDTDVEILKSFNNFLKYEAFLSFESPNLIQLCCMGSKPYHPWIGLALYWYQIVNYCNDYGKVANTRIMSRMTRLNYNVRLNGQEVEFADGMHIFTRDLFVPEKDYAGNYILTDNSVAIHHEMGLWK